MLTLGGNSPVFLDSRPIEWTSQIKQLGIHVYTSTKRKQKFASSFARIGSILCELVVVISN